MKEEGRERGKGRSRKEGRLGKEGWNRSYYTDIVTGLVLTIYTDASSSKSLLLY
jgi:hypothetical protein